MARPALSASRTMDMLDFFTAFPERGFTMSEIMRATNINVASCHAVLSALTGQGYLVRREVDRTYALGPALVAVGRSALAAHPLIGRALQAAAMLNQSLQLPTLLSTIAGDDIVVLTALDDGAGRTTGMRPGQRMPLVPPAGAHFIAWAPEDVVEAWIAKAEPKGADEVEALRQALALVRRRGFQVTLRAEQSLEFAQLMAEMAVGRQPPGYKLKAGDLISHDGWTLRQPEQIVPDERYDVVLLAAPIFDHANGTILSLGLGGFAAPLAGEEITRLAGQLVQTCLQVMRETRAG